MNAIVCLAMSERLTGAIEEIVAQINAKEAELLPLKITVNTLCQLNGESPRYEVDGMAAPGQPKKPVISIKSDQYFGRPLATCVVEYMNARDGLGMDRPTSIDDIYEALVKGGYKFESTNEANTKRAIKISLSKNTAQFAKIGENTFGLKEWYPGARTPRKNGNGKKDAQGEIAGESEGTDCDEAPTTEAKTPE